MKFKRFFKIFVIALMLFILSTITVFAEDYTNPNQFDSYTSSGTSFEVVDNTINKTLGVFLTIIRSVALCIAILMLIIIGIKYMSAPPGMKAELKKEVPTYFIGAVILFGTAGILQLVTYLVNDTL